jgi:hypothetical protein
MLTLLRRKSRGSTLRRIPTRSQSTRKCPRGYLMRKGYTRKFKQDVVNRGYTVKRGSAVFRVHPTTSTVRVKPTCVKDRGLEGTIVGPGIGPLKRGELIKFGYSYRLPVAFRREALKKAISEYTALTVYRKLDAVAKLTLRLNPSAAKKFAADRDWIKDNYGTNGLHEGI